MTMDNYIVSARKYRPTTFESVVGQKALTETLRNAIRQNHLAHAYLFCGPRGVGKTTCARIFAKTINCLNPTATHDACNECESCTAFNEQRSFNIHELDAASNNSVEDIRTLIQEVRIPPQIGKYSVYIIDEVHMLSQGAFNALLKTLEEPPSYAVFILATTEKHKVLPTILSRCQVYDFQRITVMDMVRHLQYVAAQEGVEAEEQALSVVAEKADGGMRDALSIFDQLVAFCGNKITYQQTIEVLNVLDAEYYFRLIDSAHRGSTTEALLLFNEVLQKGFDAAPFLTGLMQHLRDVLVSKDAATLELLEASDAVRERFRTQAASLTAPWIFTALDIINTADINYRTARNKRLTVELALVKLCRIGAPAEPVAAQPAPKQAAPAKPTAKPAPAAAKPAPAPAAAKPAPAQPAPAPSALPKLPSLNISRPVSEQPAQTATPTPQQRTAPFTLDRLIDVWAGLGQYFPREERLTAILRAHKPELKEDGIAYLTLANPWQKEEVAKFGAQIMQHVRDALNNDTIRLKLLVAEYAHEQQAYTAAEKFKLLNDRNPVLSDLRTALNLQLD